jgi:hypothetical protein
MLGETGQSYVVRVGTTLTLPQAMRATKSTLQASEAVVVTVSPQTPVGV